VDRLVRMYPDDLSRAEEGSMEARTRFRRLRGSGMKGAGVSVSLEVSGYPSE
jgi:hypothetical protein